MNAVPGKNLTVVFSSMKSFGGMAHDIGGALRSVMDEARFCRTTPTCIWGVSDPENPSRDRVRGVAEGVAHAPDDRFTAVDRRAHCDDGRHKNATLSTRVKLLIVRNIAGSAPCQAGRTVRESDRPNVRLTQGDHSSRVCGPPDFSSLS
jgi:hypothetical protein